MKYETAFVFDASTVKFGPDITEEVGHDMKCLGSKHVMVITDQSLTDSQAVSVVLEALRKEDVDFALFDQTRIEPTDKSFKEAAEFAVNGRFDGFVGVGGGSSIDTAKAANLYSTYPADFLAYVSPPIGKGQPVPGRLRPMIAVPTTAGTGSETTGLAIFDLEAMHVKTAVAHRFLRPALGVIDPNNTRTLPRMVAACTGFDVLTHALESFTAIPYDHRPAPENPGLRPSYQGSNPISDIWASEAIKTVSRNLPRVLQDPNDDIARAQMLLAATFAGIGFGGAGTHLAHAMSYPVSGMVRSYIPEGYPRDHPLIPHGMAVVLNAPAVFRFTAPARPERHLEAARLMGADTSSSSLRSAGEVLVGRIVELIRLAGIPNGLKAVGFGPEDLEVLVTGAFAQQRLTKLSPRLVDEADFRQLFLDSMTCW